VVEHIRSVGMSATACGHNAVGLVACVVVWLVNRFYLKEATTSILVHGYLNDAVGMFAMLCYCNILTHRVAWGRRLFTRLPGIMGFSLICGCFWEFVTPLYLARSVSDPLDFVAYLAGGITYSVIFSPCHCFRIHLSRSYRPSIVVGETCMKHQQEARCEWAQTM